MNVLSRAHSCALKSHGIDYFMNHIISVVHNCYLLCPKEIKESKQLETLICAAYLHDTLEDTDLTLIDIIEEFGSEIADVVFSVTDEPGANRKESKEKTYPKIRSNKLGMIVKLSDRIANIERCLKDRSHNYLLMYIQEYISFYDALYSEEFEVFWDILFELYIQGRTILRKDRLI